MNLYWLSLIIVLTVSRHVNAEHLTIVKLYTRTTQSNPIRINMDDDLNQVDGFCSQSECSNYLIVHGWQSGQARWMNRTMTELFKSESNINVFIADWSFGSDISGPSVTDIFGYETSIRHMNQTVREIGSLFNKYIQKGFITRRGNELIDLNCVGHSLGAHICGLLGQLLKSNGAKLAKIFGLDPAGPCFERYSEANRLDQTDADFVSVIHTSKLLGFKRPLGHVDYYPNGGTQQPGCYPASRISTASALICDKTIDFALSNSTSARGQDVIESRILSPCSHSRAYEYFIESINSKCLFTSRQCSSWKNYRTGSCFRCNHNRMGLYGFKPKDSNELHYLEINKKSPFCYPSIVINNTTSNEVCFSSASKTRSYYASFLLATMVYLISKVYW